MILTVEANESQPLANSINRSSTIQQFLLLPLITKYCLCSDIHLTLLVLSSRLLEIIVSIPYHFSILIPLFMSGRIVVEDLDNSLPSWVSNQLGEKSVRTDEVNQLPSSPPEESLLRGEPSNQ